MSGVPVQGTERRSLPEIMQFLLFPLSSSITGVFISVWRGLHLSHYGGCYYELFGKMYRVDHYMPRWGQLFILYFLSTAGLIVSVFLLGDMTLFYEGMAIIGVILITNIVVVSSQLNH